MDIPLIYTDSCPNCLGEIRSERLYAGLPCQKCLPQLVDYEQVCRFVVQGKYSDFCQTKEQVSQFAQFFRQKTNNSLREIQKMWAFRFFLNNSFAMLAPTGIGKTTFGLALASFLAQKGEKSYLIFPTQLIVNQAYERLTEIFAGSADVLAYSSDIQKTNKQKQQAKERIQNGEFDILLTTTMFLYKNTDIIPRGVFSLIFVDDVDSVLKSARNIDKILMLMGFDESDFQLVWQYLDKVKALGNNPSQAQLLELSELKERLEKVAARKKGNLLVSSATAQPRSSRLKLFTYLLGFEVGRPTLNIRKIVDVYELPQSDLFERSVEMIKRLGKGGLVFLPSNSTKQDLEQFLDFLQGKHIAAASYQDLDKYLEDFKAGEIQVLVGFASYRNPLARGLDLPQTIRYALFVGVPKLTFELQMDSHTSLYYFLLMLKSFLVRQDLLDEKQTFKLNQYLDYLEKIRYVASDKLLPQVKAKVHEIYQFTKSLLTDAVVEKINQSDDVSLKIHEGKITLITADITGYIQASGRTSRLYAGGLTQGLAYLLVDDLKAFNSLRKKARQFYEEIQFIPASEIDLDQILQQIDRDRELVRKVLRAEITLQTDALATATVVVESPNKARTIANFFGKPLRRRIHSIDIYEIATQDMILNIVASKGHLFDLNKERGYYGILKENDYFVPVYEPIDQDRQQIVWALQKIAAETSRVFIATDPDTEGEKIAFDIMLQLRPFQPHIERAEFHEVSQKAFVNAIKNPRQVSMPLVKSQLVRRISDRWIGFKISQYIQKQFQNPSLSAGRVQTPVLGWIIQREQEAKKNVYIFGVKINGLQVEFQDENWQKISELYFKAKKVTVQILEQKEQKLWHKPLATDTMLRAAAEKLGFSPDKTMKLAQDLFEAGLITYHRTDSIRVSPNGLNVAKQYISENFGEELFEPHTFASAGGAHECIRPVRPVDALELRTHFKLTEQKNITEQHLKLYDLIFRQFIASQMKPTVVLQTTALFTVENHQTQLSFPSKVLEHGADLLIPVKTYDISPGQYPITYKYTRKQPAAPRFTFATIIAEMKNKGIGRPSTYAITIQKLLDRKYIVEKNGKLFPTRLGIQVYSLLRQNPKHFHFVNENFTRELEELMDQVESGEQDWQQIIADLFGEIMA